MASERQVTDVEPYIRSHEVFSLEDLTKALKHPGGKKAVLNSLRYHLRLGRVKSVTRGVYVSVPPGVEPTKFQPDRYLVAAAVRRDAVFSHHAALELLGAAHSDWNLCTVSTTRRHPVVSLNGVRLRFLLHPPALQRKRRMLVGTQQVTRRATVLRVTGPERTLLDGFRRPELAGGPSELVESASGFGTLDLNLALSLLKLYDEKLLWAAVGWFLERFSRKFFVSPDYLKRLEQHRPKSPQYLLRSQRGGSMVKKWNLILPESLVGGAEPDES
jgi:predicted transcriptional regulator of viral defense system